MSILLAEIHVQPDGRIVVDPDPLTVHCKGGNARLRWQIETDDWEFVPGAGIVLATGPGTPFPLPPQPGKRAGSYKLDDAATMTGEFAYTIHLRQISTGKTLRHDPTIKNQGS